MANLLTVADTQAILKLHAQGWPQRRIARELDVDRETVAKHIRASSCRPKPAKAPLGSDGVGETITRHAFRIKIRHCSASCWTDSTSYPSFSTLAGTLRAPASSNRTDRMLPLAIPSRSIFVFT